ncbi:protein phosphatase 1 regulatory subunit 42-like [Microplitis demolitor]|uniref:protein phosphatase 1 regulatory subunit 42-like n=1 Tax=Microplitis demolitor TaxID=69319 RepID=UPI00235B66FA|nr:protein phosphatase 1 regulatory subunit 42-like [Microplitis demolitor]
MVLLTTNYIEKECVRTQSLKSLTKKISKNNFRTITHLYMNGKFVDAIGNLSGCKNLRVIYLQNNSISKIENLQFTVNLTHLYLQHNNIKKIENLDNLHNLKILFIGYNNICVVEQMENLENLFELRIENQRLSRRESIIFDPRSLYTLSLRILDVTGNNLTILEPLSCLCNLEILIARNNLVNDMLDLIETMKALKSLTELQLQDNPVTHHFRYRENVIANSSSLATLDGKAIPRITRNFLTKFQNEKQLRLAQRKIHKMSLSDDITTSLNLPPAFERSISRAILQPGPKLSISATSAMEVKPQIYPPWTSSKIIYSLIYNCIEERNKRRFYIIILFIAPSIAGRKDNHCTPRPFWKAVNPRQKHELNHLKSTYINSVVMSSCLNKKS